jgi:hypothetical protein
MPAKSFMNKKAQKNKKNARDRVGNAQAAVEPEAPEEIMVIKPQAVKIVPGVERNTVSVAKTINSAAFSSGMKIDIDLETQILGQLQGNMLKLTADNTSGVDIPCPKVIQNTINNIKILPNGGNTQLCEFTKETLMYPLRFLHPATLERYKRGFESADGEVIAPGESRTWYIPLLADPFAINEVFMQAIDGRLLYKVEFDKTAWTGGYPILSECSIVSRHIYFDEVFMRSKRDLDMHSILDYNFRSYVVVNPSKTITAGANFEIRLDGFGKRAIEIFLQLWKNGEQLEDLGQYIDSYDITDANNSSLIASGPIDKIYDDVVLSAVHDYQPVLGTTRDPWTVISFSPEMASDFLTGEVHGNRKFNTKEILKLKISPSLPSAGYQLRIYYGEVNKFRSAGGVLSLIA